MLSRSTRKRGGVRRRAESLLFSSLAVFASGALAQGADTFWSANTGNWSDAPNWSAGVPATGVTTYINNGGTAQIPAATPAATAGVINLGTNVGGTGTGAIEQSGSSLVAGTLNVGNQQAASYSQTGGNAT